MVSLIRIILEFRETLEEWGYLWAHRLLEDAFVRPNFDIQLILNAIIRENEETDISARSDEKYDIMTNVEVDASMKLAQLEDLQNKLHLKKKPSSSNFFKNSLSSAFMITRKVLWHMQIVGIAMTALEVFIEGEKHDKMLEWMDEKIKVVEKDLEFKIFDLRLSDLKSKFLAIKSTFELVLYGSDDSELRKSRLDAVFVICEEIFLLISESHSDLYKSAHYWIDLVSSFMILHLGMLQLAVDSFNLIDYQERFEYCLEFYPILMKSYIQRAISNYVKPIILNYHNHDSSYEEVEEIYYELTNWVIYKTNRSDAHYCWKTDPESMFKDRMFYNFKTEKLKLIEPALMIGPETPVLWRALRYGVTLKLEDLYTEYITGIDIVSLKFKEKFTKSRCINKILDTFSLDIPSEGKEESKIGIWESKELSPIRNTNRESDVYQDVIEHTVQPSSRPSSSNYLDWQFVDKDNFHYKQTLKAEGIKDKIDEVKRNAKREQIILQELFEIKANEVDFENASGFEKIVTVGEIKELVEKNEEIFDNLSKYVYNF